MKQNRPWTEQELKQVETEYLKGEKIKAIAYRLERKWCNSLNHKKDIEAYSRTFRLN